jgi:glycosyltransferase involved in cell wall biosynthesis
MISVLIPIYNGYEFMNDSVMSVINQTFEKWELLIGVNGHPEGSFIFKEAILYMEKDSRIKVFDFHNLSGKSNTLNRMISLCTYDYVALLDVDDIWHEKKLEIQSKYLKFDVIGSRCIYFGDLVGIVPQIPTGDISQFDFKIVNPMINSSCIIKKDIAYWGSDGLEDYELWLSLRNRNKVFYNCSEILVKHRIHKASYFNTKNHDTKMQKILQ